MALQQGAAVPREHYRRSGMAGARLTNGLLWDLSLYLAATPMSPKKAKPPAR